MPRTDNVPAFLQAWIPPWLQALALFAVIAAGGIALHGLVLSWLNRKPASWHPFLKHAAHRTRRLVRFIILLFAAGVSAPLFQIPHDLRDDVRKAFLALFIIQLGWIASVAANLAMDRYVRGLKLDVRDNLLARKAVTQMRLLRQAVNVMLALFTLGFALMSFDSVRQFGISLFASAGMAGIVAGLAARPLLENLIAGLQLAFTQPLRMGDQVVINNEFGTVEEITSVYIVVKLWDWRRQIVPLSYIFTNPFVNWTRSSASILGSVFFFADYTTDMDGVRSEAERVVKTSPFWDGQVVNTQLIDTTEQTIKIRILISAASAADAADLGSFMREKMIAWLRDNHVLSLPRNRQEAVMVSGAGADRPETTARLSPPDPAQAAN